MNFKGFSLIKSERRLLFGDVQIKLNPKAFDLLVFFAERAGKVLTKDEILRGLWHDSAVEEGNLPVQVAKIRKALRHHSDVSIIETIPGLGYCFATKVVSADRPRRSADGDIIRRVNIVRGTEVVAGTRRGHVEVVIECLLTAISEHPTLELQDAKGFDQEGVLGDGLGATIRVSVKDLSDHPVAILEFIGSHSETTEYRTMVPSSVASDLEMMMNVLRKAVRSWLEKASRNIGADYREEWTQSNQLEVSIERCIYLMELDTPQALRAAGILICSMIDDHPFDYRPHLLDARMTVRRFSSGRISRETAVESTNESISRARLLEAPDISCELERLRVLALVEDRVESAIKLMASLENDFPPSTEMLRIKAGLLRIAGNLEECEVLLRRVVEREPLWFGAMKELAEVQFQLGKIATSKKTMEILAMLAPPDHQSSIEMGDSPRFSDGSKKSLKTGNPGRGRLKGKAVVKENLLAIGKLKASQGEQGLARAYRKVVKDVGQRAARHPLPE